MAELVDAQVSGTCDRFGRGSSSLLQGTKNTSLVEVFCAIKKGSRTSTKKSADTSQADFEKSKKLPMITLRGKKIVIDVFVATEFMRRTAISFQLFFD